VGLNADGIDNEMMMSHLGNCGTGTCYVPEFEQLHVDGNKSLVYAMLNFSLQPPPAVFDVEGDVGYFVNPRRLVDPGTHGRPVPDGAGALPDLSGNSRHTNGTTVLAEFTIANDQQTHVDGISAEARWTNVQGESHGEAVNQLRVEYQNDSGSWTRRPVYSSGAGYRQPGFRSDWNYPEDGNYRVVVIGATPTDVRWSVQFSTKPAWEQPVQERFNVSNMDFFKELKQFVGDNGSLTGIDVGRVLSGERDLSDFDTVVIADDALLPGYREDAGTAHQGALDLPPTNYTAQDSDAIATALRDFVEEGGNLVLSDDALRALSWMGIVQPNGVGRRGVYAGNVSFTTDAGSTDTYGDPLAAGIDRPGAAEGVNKRRQVVEPVPLGFELGSDMPQWFANATQWSSAGGRIIGTEGTGNASTSRVSMGELTLGDGRIRILGAFLPFPTTANYHPFGLASYAVTDNGYTLAQNLWSWQNPAQNVGPNLNDDPVETVNSDTPTQSEL
jgi:hypothetical protein